MPPLQARRSRVGADRSGPFPLPPYAPAPNPAACLNHDFKTTSRLEPPIRDHNTLLQKSESSWSASPACERKLAPAPNIRPQPTLHGKDIRGPV